MLISLSQIHFVDAHNPLNISFKHSKSIIQKKGFVLRDHLRQKDTITRSTS